MLEKIMAVVRNDQVRNDQSAIDLEENSPANLLQSNNSQPIDIQKFNSLNEYHDLKFTSSDNLAQDKEISINENRLAPLSSYDEIEGFTI